LAGDADEPPRERGKACKKQVEAKIKSRREQKQAKAISQMQSKSPAIPIPSFETDRLEVNRG
jgi:hypothetical protein